MIVEKDAAEWRHFLGNNMLNEIYQNIDPIIFSAGPFVVRWYGLAYSIGFIAAGYLIYRTAKRWKVKIDLDALSVIMIGVIIGLIVGARLGYVLFYVEGMYLDDPIRIFGFTSGGMSFHGGLIGALLSAIITAKIVKIPYLTLADLGAVGAPIGLLLGRIANFINGELWGAPTDAPWGVIFGGAAGDIARHPTQLYEAFLEGVVIFAVLYFLSRKKPPLPRGTHIGLFLIMYGMFRFVVEFVRQPDPQLGYLWGDWLTMGQLLSFPLVIVGIGVLIYALKMKLPQQGLQEVSEPDDRSTQE